MRSDREFVIADPHDPVAVEHKDPFIGPVVRMQRGGERALSDAAPVNCLARKSGRSMQNAHLPPRTRLDIVAERLHG